MVCVERITHSHTRVFVRHREGRRTKFVQNVRFVSTFFWCVLRPVKVRFYGEKGCLNNGNFGRFVLFKGRIYCFMMS